MLGAVFIGLGVLNADAPAADAGGEAREPAQPTQASILPPSPAESMRAYNAVEPWIRAWSVPEQAGDLPRTWGACITLRLHGVTIGRGVAMTAPDRMEPDSDVIVRAAEAAIRAADRRLPVANDLLRDQAVRQITPDVQISLELAGAPLPLAADTWLLVDTTLAPGLDGVIAQRVDGDSRAEFPSTIMMTNSLPQKAIRGLAAAAIGEGGAAAVLDPPREVREKHGIRFWRFRVSHLAQCAPGVGPEFLYRGAKLRSEVPDRGQLRRMAGALASHIIRRPDDGPSENRALSQALGALALARYDQWRRQDARSPQSGVPIGEQAAFDRRCRAAAAAATSDDPALAAVLALTVTPSTAERCPGPAGEWSPFPSVRQALGLEQRLAGLSPSARALLSMAVISQDPAGASAPDQDQAAIGLAERGLAGITSAELVSAMPWYGWSQIRLEEFRRQVEAIAGRPDARAASTQSPPRDLPAAVALRQMRAEVWKHQLSELDAGDEGADLVGGIVFTSGNTSPLPTWQCVRPLAFLATMLGDARLTEPQERALELARLLKAFGFLRQLQVDESVGWMHPRPESVIGAIRSAAWDQSTPPDASSLTLLAVCELLESMDRIDAESRHRAAPER